MSYRELIPEEEYKQIVERDTKRAQENYDFIMASKDPALKYKQIRPIVNIKQMLETSVELYADRTAFLEKASSREYYKPKTYKEMFDRVNAIGTALHARGFRGSHIAVIGENSYAWSTAYLAVVCGTGVVVPLDKELNLEEIATLLEVGEVEAVFYSGKKLPGYTEEIRKNGNEKVSLWINMDAAAENLKDYETGVDALIEEGEKLLADGNRDFLDAQIDAERLGILMFTSGTTGFAKGVMLNHRNVAFELMVPTTVIGIVKEDVFFSVLPIHHSYEGVCGFLIPLTQGASIAYCQGLKWIVPNMLEAKPTVFLGVPLLFENLYSKIWQNVRKQGKESLLRKVIAVNRVTKKIGIDLGKKFFKDIHALFGGRMRLLICGGAAIDPAVIDGLVDLGINAIQGYGLTESAPICALNPIQGGRSDSAGYLIPGFYGKIVDADPETGIGEICVKGLNVMMGYYKNDEATAEVMHDGWFHTGDYGRIDSDGYVYITGRKKSVIITKNGKNVFPEELEYLIARSPVVGEVMVWEAEGDVSDDTIIAATILPSPDELKERFGTDIDDDKIAKLLWEEVNKVNDTLPIFKKVRRLYHRKDAFEQTTSKKIKRFKDENRTGIEI
ncbi:MAG: AMP-binding protein [Clostridiales Family XIII bacterium]|jgi:long-chain acyl-CoA synthetase|nr:AMP-binding protein [Clostridiales Family XIII bacterium]